MKFDTHVYYVVNSGSKKGRFISETYNNLESAKKRCLKFPNGRVYQLVDRVKTLVFNTIEGEIK